MSLSASQQSLSQTETHFYNVNFIEPKQLTVEYANSSGAALFVDKDWEANPLNQSMQGYFQPSSVLTKLKRLALNENIFANFDLGIDPYSLGLWQSQLVKTQLEVDSIKKAIERESQYFRFSGQAYKMAGASDHQELAILLASLVQLEEDYRDQVTADELWQATSVELTMTSHLFESMTKVQALRLLIARLCELDSTTSNVQPKIYCAPSFRHMATREPWTNILRLTAMQSAAVMGGAQGFLSLPFDFLSKGEGGRVSRNSLEVLTRESHLGRVSAPNGGSQTSNKMLDELCEKSWVLFTEILKKGGLKDCLRSGWLHEVVESNEEEERSKFFKRERVLTGVNQYALAESLDKEFPLVSQEQALDIESFWEKYLDNENKEHLCDVKRWVPNNLASHFEKFQYRGEKLSSIPVLIESKECRQKKWALLVQLLQLAGLKAHEVSPEANLSSAIVFVMASDPDGDFVKDRLAEIKKLNKVSVFWAGEKHIDSFDGYLGVNGNLEEIFNQMFSLLEGKS